MDGQIAAALIGGGFTAGAALLGFGAVAWQVARQGRLSREERRETEQRRFKAELYDDGLRAARAMSERASEFSGYLRNVRMQLELAHGLAAHGQRYAVPTVRYVEIMAKYRAFWDALLSFVALIEERQILDPRMLIFRDMIFARSHDFTLRYPNQFQAALMPALPMDSPNGGTFPYQAPTSELLSRLIEEVELACDVLLDCVCFKEDFIVEMQNTLLGDVFDSRVDHRKPLDPDKRVARLEDFNALQAWIETTAWGKHCTTIEAESRERFNAVSE